MNSTPQPKPELHRQRTIEAVSDTQLLRQFLRRIGRQHRDQGIAGRDVHQQEAHQRHADHDRDDVDDTPESVDKHGSPWTSLLPLWEKVARAARRMRGSLREFRYFGERCSPAEADPSPVSNELRSFDPPSPTRGEGKEPPENYGTIDTGEKSTNQLFGCTKPLIFGLIARGATSWAT